jgi:hypothetical protein
MAVPAQAIAQSDNIAHALALDVGNSLPLLN